MDLNSNTWDSNEAPLIKAWGLTNSLKTQQPTLAPVATCDKNRKNKPIDGIWCSPSLDISRAGMHSFGSPDMGYTDHRMLWIDIDMDSLFRYQPPPLAPIQLIGIPIQDPAIANRYNNALRKAHHTLNIPNQILWLEQRAITGKFDADDAKLFERLLTKSGKNTQATSYIQM
jgi:hypothetical protein